MFLIDLFQFNILVNNPELRKKAALQICQNRYFWLGVSEWAKCREALLGIVLGVQLPKTIYWLEEVIVWGLSWLAMCPRTQLQDTFLNPCTFQSGWLTLSSASTPKATEVAPEHTSCCNPTTWHGAWHIVDGQHWNSNWMKLHSFPSWPLVAPPPDLSDFCSENLSILGLISSAKER